jgi:hypothetical protein
LYAEPSAGKISTNYSHGMMDLSAQCFAVFSRGLITDFDVKVKKK